MVDRELGIADLRDIFHVAEASWLVYRRRDGSLGCLAATEKGEKNVAREIANGGKLIGRATGVSGKEAIAAAKRMT